MAHSTMSDLTVEEFKQVVREVLIQTLTELSSKSDEDMDICDDLKLEFQHSLAAVETGIKTTPVQDIAERLGLTW
jgi:hypothetical protein